MSCHRLEDPQTTDISQTGVDCGGLRPPMGESVHRPAEEGDVRAVGRWSRSLDTLQCRMPLRVQGVRKQGSPLCSTWKCFWEEARYRQVNGKRGP